MILSRKKGFTLTEILIAVALTGVALVIICSVFFRGLLGIKGGQTSGTAMYIASKKIDEVKSVDLGKKDGICINELYQHIEGYGPDTPEDLGSYISWSPTGAISEKIITGNEGSDGEYKFTVEIKNCYEGSSAVKDLKIVRVEVKWYDNLREREKIIKIDALLARKAY